MGYQFNPLTGKLDLVGSGGGSATTDASLLTSGTLADNRLSSNVSLDNINNSFTAGQTITAPANTSALTAAYSVTGANTTPLLDLSGTWNTTGAARGILLNITDTASAATSLLFDFRVNNSSRLSLTKFGVLSCGNNIILASGTASNLIWQSSGVTSLALIQEASNTLAQRNGTNAQTFRLYNTFTDASNFERGFMRWNSNVLEIGTEAGGTGTARSFSVRIGAQSSGVDFTAAGSGVNVSARSFISGGVWSITAGNMAGLSLCNYTSGAADPTTSTLTSGNWQVYRNTTTGVVKLWANNAGTLVSVALS
jgi:hypothetical protein